MKKITLHQKIKNYILIEWKSKNIAQDAIKRLSTRRKNRVYLNPFFISYDIRIQQQIVQIITNIWNIKTIVDFSYEISTMEGIRLQAVLSSLSQPETFTSQSEAFYFHDLLFVYQLVTCFYDLTLLTSNFLLIYITIIHRRKSIIIY